MTRKDYVLIGKWVKDYSYIAEIRPEDGGERYNEHKWYRGALQALLIRLEAENPKFSSERFLAEADIKNIEL